VPGPTTSITSDDRTTLLAVAARAIGAGAKDGQRSVLPLSTYNAALLAPGASFITLQRAGRLRGCIGKLTPILPLVEDVHENAYRTAFEDPRFPAVTADELSELELEISILTPPVPREVSSRALLLELLTRERPGLVISDRDRRATFLPKVWDSIPDAEQFLVTLALKAGLPADHWSDTVRIETYTTDIFGAGFDDALAQ
jgi:uncharacterized protein